jgi:hypothetical protein
MARWAAAVALVVGLLALMHFAFGGTERKCAEWGGKVQVIGRTIHCMDGDRMLW